MFVICLTETSACKICQRWKDAKVWLTCTKQKRCVLRSRASRKDKKNFAGCHTTTSRVLPRERKLASSSASISFVTGDGTVPLLMTRRFLVLSSILVSHFSFFILEFVLYYKQLQHLSFKWNQENTKFKVTYYFLLNNFFCNFNFFWSFEFKNICFSFWNLLHCYTFNFNFWVWSQIKKIANSKLVILLSNFYLFFKF